MTNITKTFLTLVVLIVAAHYLYPVDYKYEKIDTYKCEYNKYTKSTYNCKPAYSNYRHPSSSN